MARADNILTPAGIANFVRLDKPRQQTDENGEPQGKPKYEVTMEFAPGTDLSQLKQAALAVAKEAFPKNTEALIKNGKLKWPFKTADETDSNFETGASVVGMRSVKKVGVVDIRPDESGRPAVLDPASEDVYSGMLARALVRPYAYDVGTSKGVAFGLNAVQKMGDADRRDGSVNAQNAFEADMSLETVSTIAVAAGVDEDDGPLV